MDIFGTVLGVAQAAHYVVKKVGEIKDAPGELERLVIRIKASVALLERIVELSENLNEADREALSGECGPALQKVRRLLEDITQKYKGLEGADVWRKLRHGIPWIREKKDIESKVKEMKDAEAVLEGMVTVLMAKDTRDVKEQVERLQHMMEKAQAIVDHDRIKACLDSLPRDDGDSEMDKQLANSQHSPPSWILESHAVRGWLSEKKAESRWLWALGEPGTGKTCIASFMVDQLRNTNLALLSSSQIDLDESDATSIPDVAAALFYCSYKKGQAQDVGSICRYLVRQLLYQLWHASSTKAYQRLESTERMVAGTMVAGNAPKPQAILNSIAGDFSTTFIIVDALDEHPEKDEVLRFLKNLSSPSIRIFVTSREGLGHYAEDIHARILDVNDNAAALQTYVTTTLELIVQGDPSVTFTAPKALVAVAASPEKRQDIANRVINAANGNFLCAQLQLRALMSEREERSLLRLLDRLATRLEDLIVGAIERVDSQQSQDDAEVGKLALLWAIYSCGSLTVKEIQHAIAFSRTHYSRRRAYGDEAEEYTIQKLTESTCYFLRIDAGNDPASAKVQVHKAVRDFCHDVTKKGKYFEKAEITMATACVDCLSQIDQDCKTKSDWDQVVTQSPFQRYAAQHWGWHLSQASNEARVIKLREKAWEENLVEQLESDAFLNNMTIATQPAWAQLGVWQDRMWDMLSEDDGDPVFHATHYLALHNLDDMAKDWLDDHPDDVDRPSRRTNDKADSGFSPLILAAFTNSAEVAKVLMQKGANATRYNGPDEMTALAAACSARAETVVKELLRDKARAQKLVCQIDSRQETPLVKAAISGSESIASRIVQRLESMPRGLETLLRGDTDENNALHKAAYVDHVEVVDVLLKTKGAHDLVRQHTIYWKDTPLHLAALHGSTRVLRSLLNAGASPNALQSQKKTPLMLAVQSPVVSTGDNVAILIPITDLTVQDQWGCNVLHNAAVHGRRAHVATLVKHVPHDVLHAKQIDGWTALLAAVRVKALYWKDCVDHLIGAMGREISAFEAREVFTVLCDHGFARVCRRLIEQFDDPRVFLADSNHTLLRRAVMSGDKAIVAAIIDRYGTGDLEVPNPFGQTPLVEASGRQFTNAKLIEYLLEKGANVNAQGGAGRTAMHWATEMGRKDIVEILMRYKPDLTIKDCHGVTAAMKVSSRNPCREVLLKAGVYPEGEETVTKEREILSASRDATRVVIGSSTRTSVPKERMLGYERGVYLETDRLPNDLQIPVSRIAVSVTGRDQGWSDHVERYPRDRGSYRFCNTWYEIGIKRAPGSRPPPPPVELTRNRLNAGSQTYSGVWDVDKGHETPGLSRWTRPEDFEEVKKFLWALQPGDRLQLIGRAQWLGWECVIEKAEIKVFCN
ncbi:uncharacterized protein E0L32_002902 [Thyridium curvatum]|uniref:Nephrocystin 3-like N-terminal domain-containing protein n=1 Tax=Thyridium curvatum TaxID=1093900 RepID=A0A507BKY5_9PEZI|nr:uncharacterized protein E0L32_002902 [Thyridium curvatum]TPX17801.1 hypothetical protein E0L32_002902 [Thyridium curvatum]